MSDLQFMTIWRSGLCSLPSAWLNEAISKNRQQEYITSKCENYHYFWICLGALVFTVTKHVFITSRFALCFQEQLSAILGFWMCCACLKLQKSVLKSFTFQPVPVSSCLTWYSPYPAYHGTLSSFNCVWSSPLKCEKHPSSEAGHASL